MAMDEIEPKITQRHGTSRSMRLEPSMASALGGERFQAGAKCRNDGRERGATG